MTNLTKYLLVAMFIYTPAFSCGCVDSGNASAGANNINSTFDNLDSKLANEFKKLNTFLADSVKKENENLKQLKLSKKIGTYKILNLENINFELSKQKDIR